MKLDGSKITRDEVWLQENGKYKCPVCDKEYSKAGIITHIYRAHTNRKFSSGHHGKYKNKQYIETMSNATKNHYKKINGELKLFKVYCHKCKKLFEVEEHENKFPTKEIYFCSRRCANIRIQSEETKNKISKSTSKALIEKWATDEEYAKKCMANNKRFTSKNEVLIRDYIINKFPEDKWSFGGSPSIEGYRISRDLYSKKLKICFEYDGIWHFSKVHDGHNLEKKQLKDRLLRNWCAENNYRLIRMSESYFINNNKNLSEIEDLIYSNNDREVFLGEEYINLHEL